MSIQLGELVFEYFEEYLKCQQGLRPTTLRSYRECIRLFLQFISKQTGHKITRLKLTDLTSEHVRQFLNYLEQERGNTVQTRNQRLAALHRFFEFASNKEPLILAEAQRVAFIPVKRTQPPETLYLERDEMERLLASFTDDSLLALRDHVLLIFLYNTGARAQEVANLRISHLELGEDARVHLHGKGDKWRTCPLWSKTVTLLEKLIKQYHRYANMEEAVFMAKNGRPLTRFGIYKAVRRHTNHIVKKTADGKKHAISPHVFRHTTAVHLLESGVEVNVIRAWLGHVSLETTNRYAEINLRMKIEALRTCEPEIEASDKAHQRIKWEDDLELLHWLESL